MKVMLFLGLSLSLLAPSIAIAVEGVIEEGKWSMLEEPMEVGNMGFVFDASVEAEDYESGPLRDMTFQCQFKEPQISIRVIGENLSTNNGAVVYSIDDGAKGKWDMETKHDSGVFLQSNGETAVSAIRELLGHEKLAVFLKLTKGRTKTLTFDITGIEDRIHYVRVLCNI